MDNVTNIDDHKCFICVCGFGKFWLLKSGKIQCIKCKNVTDCQWQTNEYAKINDDYINFLNTKNEELENLIADIYSDYDKLENNCDTD